MRKSLAVVLVLGLVLTTALSVAGCGGDDDNGSSATAGGGGATTADADSGGGSDGASNATDAGLEVSESGDNETGISKKEFIRKSEAICRDIRAKAGADVQAMVKDPSDAEGSFKELVEYSDKVVNEVLAPRYREEIKRIRALGYPEGDEAYIEGILVSLEQTIQRAEEDPEAFSQLNTVEGNPENPFEREDSLARRYGLKICPRV